eukprot:scaffold32087_cov101-Isochrysis_galbana.AAC.1
MGGEGVGAEGCFKGGAAPRGVGPRGAQRREGRGRGKGTSVGAPSDVVGCHQRQPRRRRTRVKQEDAAGRAGAPRRHRRLLRRLRVAFCDGHVRNARVPDRGAVLREDDGFAGDAFGGVAEGGEVRKQARHAGGEDNTATHAANGGEEVVGRLARRGWGRSRHQPCGVLDVSEQSSRDGREPTHTHGTKAIRHAHRVDFIAGIGRGVLRRRRSGAAAFPDAVCRTAFCMTAAASRAACAQVGCEVLRPHVVVDVPVVERDRGVAV